MVRVLNHQTLCEVAYLLLLEKNSLWFGGRNRLRFTSVSLVSGMPT